MNLAQKSSPNPSKGRELHADITLTRKLNVGIIQSASAVGENIYLKISRSILITRYLSEKQGRT